MRFDFIGMKGIGNTRARERLREQAPQLTAELTIEFASLLIAFGVNTATPTAMIAKLVSDFVQGWAIDVANNSKARWRRHAAIFAYQLDNNRNASEAQFQAVEQAFLDGLSSGVGDFNWQADPIKTRVMAKRATKAGLEPSPVRPKTRRLVEAVEIEARPRSGVNLQQYMFDPYTDRTPKSRHEATDETQYEDNDDDDEEVEEEEESDDDDQDMLNRDGRTTGLGGMTAEDLEFVSARDKARDLADEDYDDDMSGEE